MKKIINNSMALALFMLFNACIGNSNKQPSATNQTQNNISTDSTIQKADIAKIDTIRKLGDQVDSVAVIQSPTGKYYTVYLTDESGNKVQAKDIQRRPTDTLYCVTDIFLGTYRKNVKTTIVQKTFQNYNKVAPLLATLQPDSVMRNLTPPITNSPSSPRVTQEKRNVKIKTAYIYAVRREDDNDFHIIIGDTLPFNASKAINIEISGLPNPANNSTDTIQNVRNVVEAFFGERCSGSYSTFSPPIPITVSGSLFYDIDHAPGIVGTGIYKPSTSWEIHPVKSFVFK